MKTKDSLLLERAYLSINQKIPSIPSDEQEKDELSDEIDIHDSEDEELSPEEETIEDVGGDPMPTEMPVSITEPSIASAPLSIDDCCDDETHDMKVDNLNSIRESVTKIATVCAQGGSLEVWQQQKIAIAMDNLAEVARRIRF
jgi:hypothetical protein